MSDGLSMDMLDKRLTGVGGDRGGKRGVEETAQQLSVFTVLEEDPGSQHALLASLGTGTHIYTYMPFMNCLFLELSM